MGDSETVYNLLPGLTSGRWKVFRDSENVPVTKDMLLRKSTSPIPAVGWKCPPGRNETFLFSNPIPVKPDTDYTISWVCARDTDAGKDKNFEVYLLASPMPTSEDPWHWIRGKRFAIGGGRKHFSATLHTGPDWEAAYVRFDNNRVTEGTTSYQWVGEIMMVEGSTPAAWAPAEGETLTADGGGGTMTEPTNLVKTQPDENEVQTIARIWSRLDGTAQDSTTDYHIAATINPDAQIAAGAIGLSIKYIDSSGADNWPRSASIASAIPANAWTRVEGTVTLPAGMTPYAVSIWWPSVMHFRACNLVVYPLTGGRIVRARGATAGYISKAKEATVLYTPSKSARQVRVILLDETGSSIYDIQSVAIVADAEELQGKVAAQESSIQTIQSDMTTVQSGLSGLNVRLASMQTELAGVSAGDVLYQVPYTVSDGKATFTAAVYKSGVECHTSYDPSCFTWYLKSEAGTVKIGTGYSVTVNVADAGYGGFVVGVFETQ